MKIFKFFGKILIVLMVDTSIAYADSISKPAGDLPNLESSLSTSMPMRKESAKSRLIPVKPVMKVAQSMQPEKKLDVVQDLKPTVATSAPLAPVKEPQADVRKDDLTQNKKIVEQKSTYPSERKRTPLKVASQNLSENVEGPSIQEADPWDSAAKRFDHQDPAKSVTKGIRVEEIIEPTSDYQYAASRRKNPFVPELNLGHSSKQKELNPNDVEIPIINPLQSFPVSQLSVIGVWQGDDQVWKALIQTPTNQGIETKLGDPAGNSGGRVMSISPDSVVVREFLVRSDGTREYKDIPLNMGSSDKTDLDKSLVGGRVILRPGSSTPEIEAPDPDAKALQETDTVPASNKSGALSTIVKSVMEDPDSAGAASALGAANAKSSLNEIENPQSSKVQLMAPGSK